MLEWVRQIVERGIKEWKKGGPELDYNTQAVVMQIQSELQKIQQKDKQTKNKEKTGWDPKRKGEVEMEGARTQEQTETITSVDIVKGLKKLEKEVKASTVPREISEKELMKLFEDSQKKSRSKQTQKTRYKKRQPTKAQSTREAPKGWATKITDPDQLHIVSNNRRWNGYSRRGRKDGRNMGMDGKRKGRCIYSTGHKDAAR